jgi:hypothetical protein
VGFSLKIKEMCMLRGWIHFIDLSQLLKSLGHLFSRSVGEASVKKSVVAILFVTIMVINVFNGWP